MKLFFDERQCSHSPERELHNGDWAPAAETAERPRSILREEAGPESVRDFGKAPLLDKGDDEVLILEGYLAHVLSIFDEYFKLLAKSIKLKYGA